MGDVIRFMSKRHGGRRCDISLMREVLSPASEKKFLEIMADPSWSAADIVRWLEDNNIFIGMSTMYKHLSGRCQTCKREAA